MGKVIEIGITKDKGDQIESIDEADVIQGKGIVNDRHLRENNEKGCQITLIEIENIKHYNRIHKTNIPAIKFRRNIITENIKLNDLVGYELLIGSVKVKAHDLCRPCRYLQESLKQKNLVKEFLYKGGIRCEILTSGKISVNDIIKKIE